MHIIQFKQTIPTSLKRCWDFFATPNNLEILMPPYLGFSSMSDSTSMYEGQIILHRVRPFLGLSVQWVTEITHIKPLEYFVDEQRIGPYKFWHHEHRFVAISQGVEVIDTIHYLLPWGIIGRTINRLKVNKDLDAIFGYRSKRITEIFEMPRDSSITH